MAKKKDLNNGREEYRQKEAVHRLHPETKRSILAVAFIGVAILFFLAGFEKAGPAGDLLRQTFQTLLGWGYFALPTVFLILAGVFLFSEKQKFVAITLIGASLLMLSFLGLLDLWQAGAGGWLGLILGSLKIPFGGIAAGILNSAIFLVAILVTLNAPLKIPLPYRTKGTAPTPIAQTKETAAGVPAQEKEPKEGTSEEEKAKVSGEETGRGAGKTSFFSRSKKALIPSFKNYVPPPLELLKSSIEKPTAGDLRANANIIKRTLESFGVPVEMGEINIGPKVTRYTLKPAEGIKLSRITALNQDLALALASHPIRIEAPIPGKSLVGIEVPNKTAALVRLGSLMAYPEFQTSGLLGFTLGRDVTGEPIFADLERMPHLLIAGATGGGKSIMIHSLLISLLYKNSPSSLKMILIDPKRVELSVYEGIPHLVSPVIVENKKALGVFRWAIQEMERRYTVLQSQGSRDIKSYNAKLSSDPQPLPYIVIVIDELADLMTSFGREVEGSIVRLAQMARATGVHLVLSTQRPSVEIITGLIKANITSRIALQVASQIDSRTIIDTAGAEKLLGAGDLLFISSELSKPKRIQGAYISEEEIKKVSDFIREHNAEAELSSAEASDETGSSAEGARLPDGHGENGSYTEPQFEDYLEDDEDELYDQAVEIVRQAQKASASLLQRRLKVGYARAARLLDLMEEKELIGPGEGAKPREVFLDKTGIE